MATDEEMFGPVVERDQDLSFVVFGPTGSGKTTLINYMTAGNMGNVNAMRGGQAQVSVDSATKRVCNVKSQKFAKGNGHYTLQFFDTPGHGAKDQKDWLQGGSLMADTVKQLMSETGRLNGVMLVLKMERFRSDLEEALKEYIKMFALLELEKAAFLVVITHSLPFTEDIKTAYAQNIAELFQQQVLPSNVIHVNVAMLPEMVESFQQIYQAAVPGELRRFKDHLLGNFEKEYNIRHWFDKERGLNASIDKVFPAKRLRLTFRTNF